MMKEMTISWERTEGTDQITTERERERERDKEILI
jgi:hypothetical protein